MKTISIIIGKILIFIGKLVNKGSTLPGEYALKIDKNLIKKFQLPEKIIAVTGSSGKGSTTPEFDSFKLKIFAKYWKT